MSDLRSILVLLNQLICKFKGAVEGLLAETLETVLAALDRTLADHAPAGGAAALANTEQQREVDELKAAYHLMLNTIAGVPLLRVLLGALSPERLQAVVAGLVHDASTHNLATVRRPAPTQRAPPPGALREN